MEKHEPHPEGVEGQHFIMFPEGIPFIEGAVGKATDDTTDYVLRSHRGEVRSFLKRRTGVALKVDSMAAIVYTKAAYLIDPDVAKDPGEIERVAALNVTHVIVALLSPLSPPEPGRLVANFAGGNRLTETMTREQLLSGAKDCHDFWGVGGHCIIAD